MEKTVNLSYTNCEVSFFLIKCIFTDLRKKKIPLSHTETFPIIDLLMVEVAFTNFQRKLTNVGTFVKYANRKLEPHKFLGKIQQEIFFRI